MAKQQISLKQLAINKDNTAILITVGLAAFIVVFSLVASNALLKQRTYQSKVITKKQAALKQLKTNANEVDKLKTSYQAFADSPTNVLEGNAKGTGDRDGENPRLVLDALPSKYDFPALATSIEKMFRQYSIESLSGTDDELAQATAQTSTTPQPVEIPFSIALNSSPQSSKDVLRLFERSIRPIQIKTLSIEAGSGQVKINADANTYFQPQKKFDVKLENVR
jgi:hypothetical protein